MVLLVYTYCSYKGSFRGYQYSFFDTSKKADMGRPVMSMKNSDKNKENMGIVRKWFENRHGWKLVLKKNNMQYEDKDKGILLISRIEEETGIYWKEREYRADVPEQKFFINIAFAGDLKELMLIAAHYIYDLMYSKPYSCIWTGHMEKFLERTPDNEKYQLNLAEWNSLLKEIKEWGEKERNKIMLLRQDNKLPPVRLLEEKIWKHKKSPKSYREEIKSKIINRLLQYSEYKEEYILVIGNGSHCEEMSNANMAFDIYYARKHYI